jgi:type VI secretion system secreted protein VgrG
MGGRALTAGEISLAKRVFKDSLDYGKIKIHNEKYAFFQPDESGMTPNGEIHVSGAGAYAADYSSVEAYLRSFFIHEMVHVWQYQLNILSPVSAAVGESIRNLFDYSKAYEYELAAGKDLLDYRIEQQAQIVEDYYLWFLEATKPARKRIKNGGAPSTYLPLYSQVLARFLNNPGYARHVTVCNRNTYGPPGSRGITCTRRLAP